MSGSVLLRSTYGSQMTDVPGFRFGGQALTALGLSTNGWRVEGVEIDPDQFFEECSATQTPRDLHSLHLFTLKIAAVR